MKKALFNRTAADTFWETFGENGILFTPTSGHTVIRLCFACNRKQCGQIGLFLKDLGQKCSLKSNPDI